MILASGRGLAHALGGRSGRVVQVQRSWGVPRNLDTQQFDGGPASKIDVGNAVAGAPRGRERIERIAPEGCGFDAASFCGVTGECKLMRRINNWSKFISKNT